MLDSHSWIQLWDENVKTLVAFQSVAALEDVAEIKMYQGPFPAAGFLKIYFGYRSPDGTVVVNGEPIEVKVTE